MLQKERLYFLDSVRGFALVNMILYHALYDVVYIFGHPIDWYRSNVGYFWQQSICWCFILLSGFCFRLGKRPFRRGGMIFAMGCVISLVTVVVMPEQRVRFGILSFLGVAMMLTELFQPVLKKIPASAGIVVSFLLFLATKAVPTGGVGIGDSVLYPLPTQLYETGFLYPLGFPYNGFFSSDYFSVIPWLFLYWTGFYLAYLTKNFGQSAVFYQKIPPFHWIGRYSLWIYMVHQPVVYALLFAWHMAVQN